MSKSSGVGRVYVDLREWDRCAPWMTRRAWGVSFLERLCRLLAKFPEVEIVGLARNGQSLDETARQACGRIETRAVSDSAIAAPSLRDAALHVPVNLVFTREWIRSAMEGHLGAAGSVLVDSQESYELAKRLMFQDSYKTLPEGLAKPHRALAWYLGQPFFYLRVPPNVTSILSLVMNLIGGWLVLSGRFSAGALVFVLTCLLDSVDGVTARLHVKESKFGTVLDNYLDYVYYVVLMGATGLGLYLQSGSIRPLVYMALSLLGTVIAVLGLERYRRVYGFESGQAFNKHISKLIVNAASFKRLASVLHMFKRHTLPYMYLLVTVLGIQEFALLVPSMLGFAVPLGTAYIFRGLERQGLLSRSSSPWWKRA